MACGCVDNSCQCVIQGGSGVGVSGSGTPGNPFIITATTSPTFSASNTDGGITITPGGTLGHTPVFNLNLDPFSPSPLSVSEDGLSVGCCEIPARGVGFINGDVTLDDTYFIVLVESDAGAITVTLPIDPPQETRYDIKDLGSGIGGPRTGDASVNNITIDAGFGQDIDGLSTLVMSIDGQAASLMYIGSSHWIAL